MKIDTQPRIDVSALVVKIDLFLKDTYFSLHWQSDFDLFFVFGPDLKETETEAWNGRNFYLDSYNNHAISWFFDIASRPIESDFEG